MQLNRSEKSTLLNDNATLAEINADFTFIMLVSACFKSLVFILNQSASWKSGTRRRRDANVQEGPKGTLSHTFCFFIDADQCFTV